MAGIIIGAIMAVGGVLLSLVVSKKIRNKNVEIQYMKTTPLADLKKNLEENASSGLDGYREFAELKGAADADSPLKTPYSDRDVAYYDAAIYQVFEETETYTDEQGTHQRLNRSEDLMSSEKSPGYIVMKDEATGEKAYIEPVQHGMHLDTVKTLDKFEPTNMMGQYGFFQGFRYNQRGTRTLGFRMVENTIPLGQPLYVLGDAYLEGGKVKVSKPADSKKPFIVSVKNETDLVHGNKVGAALALYGGIVLAVAGVLVAIFVH
jgi:hypothetical protein